MLQEVNERELKKTIADSSHVIAFFHTPFCGTCKLAGHMIESALQTMSLHGDAVSCNLNMMPAMAETYEITSVPCLMLFEQGKVKDRIYAFRSAACLKNTFIMQGFVKNR